MLFLQVTTISLAVFITIQSFNILQHQNGKIKQLYSEWKRMREKGSTTLFILVMAMTLLLFGIYSIENNHQIAAEIIHVSHHYTQ